MKAVIIYRIDISEPNNAGVSKKMQGQLQGLIHQNVDTDCIYLNSQGVMCNENLIYKTPKNKLAYKWFKAKTYYRKIAQHISAKDYDLLLFRFNLLMPGFIRLVKKLKIQNPTLKIVIDMPTFPYNQEWSGFLGKVLLKIDENNQGKLKHYIDLFIHYGSEKEIYGIPCYNSSNGILPGLRPTKKKGDDTKIHLIAVGKWRDWHGLDRVISGLGEYYRINKEPKEIFLHVVGEGDENKKYQALVKHLGLEGMVKFYGNLYGQKLENLYRKADIGIGTLGLPRKGVKIDSSLKHREYCMRGLPFILGEKDLDFDANLNFVRYFPGDSIIQIDQLVTFFDGTRNIEDLQNEIYQYAIENLTWSKKIEGLLKSLS